MRSRIITVTAALLCCIVLLAGCGDSTASEPPVSPDSGQTEPSAPDPVTPEPPTGSGDPSAPDPVTPTPPIDPTPEPPKEPGILDGLVFPREDEVYNEQINAVSGYHGGGDYHLLRSIINHYNGKNDPNITTLSVSMQSHYVGFAAERSRHTGETVKL